MEASEQIVGAGLPLALINGALDKEPASPRELVQALGEAPQLDLRHASPSAIAYLLGEAHRLQRRRFVVVTSSNDEARRMQDNLAFFMAEPVLRFPALDASPFVRVTDDRRTVMQRLAVLYHLAQGLAWSALVLPAPALLRRLPPARTLRERSARVVAEAELDREELQRRLVAGGYLRVPVVEDPGTFAVRGSIVDVFAPQMAQPARIELDDWLVLSIKTFDTEDQRSGEGIDSLNLPPVSHVPGDAESLEEAAKVLRRQADEQCMPSAKIAALLHELREGRLVYGAAAYAPAFGSSATLWSYLNSHFFPDRSPDAAAANGLPDKGHRAAGAPFSTVLLHPYELARRLQQEDDSWRDDHAARQEAQELTFPLQAYRVSQDELSRDLSAQPLTRVHRLAVLGEDPPGYAAHEPPHDDPSLRSEAGLGAVEGSEVALWQVLCGPKSATALSTDSDWSTPVAPGLDPSADHRSAPVRHGSVALSLGAQDLKPLQQRLSQQRLQDKAATLKPLGDALKAWLQEGLRVVMVARTRVQAERLAVLLRDYDVPVRRGGLGAGFEAGERGHDAVELRTGELTEGFIMPSAGLVCVAEEDVFGTRRHRRHRPRSHRDKQRAFLEDLRELQVGDYVVHAKHGIGKYLGIERKALGQSRTERLQGQKAVEVETLVVEYSGGKLYLPVTRLDQLAKHSAKEGQAPRLDKLGGQSFSKTKAKVRKQVRQIADKLLRLYAERNAHQREPLAAPDRLYSEFEATFPFEETADQARAIDDVLGDLEQARVMDRLVCGDVGFGKTEVAIRATFRVASAGRQVAVLCPTTVLAQQHFRTFQQRLSDYPLRVEVVSRFVERAEQQRILVDTKLGKVDVLVGTHRLLSKDVHFAKLGLLVVDEEQRFGVTHKERIKELRSQVDVLTLSATPIPRTLHMALGGLRDLSLITTAPVDRRAVRTLLCRWDPQLLKGALDRELGRGGQVFFVYNRVEGLYERAQRLQEIVPGARVAVAHGQMKEGALEQVMTDFIDGRYDVLCSTAIIESGIDIPRANTMIIDRADMFGLAQLYQLRGRVGRARERAYCYLVTPPPDRLSDEARYRLDAIERFTALGSGFQIASLDLELRGAGDLLGAEQSGSMASVGLDLFVRMLDEAMAELRGEAPRSDIEPELALSMPHGIPEDYIADVGMRLAFYKRLAGAEDDAELHELALEMEDRFGPPPTDTKNLVRVMGLKPPLRRLQVLGCEASAGRVTLHLHQDSPLDPQHVAALVGGSPRSGQGTWRLSPDLKLTYRVPSSGLSADGAAYDAVDWVHHVLRTLEANGSSNAHS